MIVFYGISDEEEKKRREVSFKQKYNIKQELGANAIWLAFGIEFYKKYKDPPSYVVDHGSYWKNADGHLVIRSELYSPSEDTRKKIEEWCEKFEFDCIYDKELLPFHDVAGIEVLVLVSKIKYRNARECRKRGWIE
ncbi:MAG TPA: hypothetical protein DCZ74_06585 [Treponema sp.]|nr:hypothetical protein [Treponema sp.]